MFNLKRLSKNGIPTALKKAERYRLLNEPKDAESICLDILERDPKNQKAVAALLLAITDQFDQGIPAEANRARDLLPRLKSKYERTYYDGIICERMAKAILNRGVPGAKSYAYQWFREAMELFENAETLRPPGNEAAILRWNTCARIISKENLTAMKEEAVQTFLE